MSGGGKGRGRGMVFISPSLSHRYCCLNSLVCVVNKRNGFEALTFAVLLLLNVCLGERSEDMVVISPSLCYFVHTFALIF